jgi:hypothetical protein
VIKINFIHLFNVPNECLLRCFNFLNRELIDCPLVLELLPFSLKEL